DDDGEDDAATTIAGQRMCSYDATWIPTIRNLYTGYLLGVGGLMQAIGVPLESLIFADTREGKAEPFIAHDITYFVDDAIDVLTYIRVSCRNSNPPLFALGAHAKGGRNLLQFVPLLLIGSSRMAPISLVHISTRSLGHVRPWDER
ncbi:MAG: hypothetical protein ACKPKO_45110, partial [Candidatus Fonsibacter sp.]